MSLTDPILALEGRPLVRPVLAAFLHLDRLTEEHAPALSAVVEDLWDWQGAQYQVADLSVSPRKEPARRTHLDYVPGHCACVRAQKYDSKTMQHIANVDARILRDDFHVHLSNEASIYTAPTNDFEFWAVIGELTEARDNFLACYSSMAIRVPLATPLGEFEERVTRLAAMLPLRWGAAGLSYASSPHHWKSSAQAIYAHARRHLGFDTAFHHRSMRYLYDHVRTASWLTFVGHGLADEGKLKLAPSGDVEVTPLDTCTKLRAGPTPIAGDANRLSVPTDYVVVDQMIRSVRANQGDGMVFIGPWRSKGVESWARRFERFDAMLGRSGLSTS